MNDENYDDSLVCLLVIINKDKSSEEEITKDYMLKVIKEYYIVPNNLINACNLQELDYLNTTFPNRGTILKNPYNIRV